jgi:hypothetical protein
MILLIVDAKGRETVTSVERVEALAVPHNAIRFWREDERSSDVVRLTDCIRVELLPEN